MKTSALWPTAILFLSACASSDFVPAPDDTTGGGGDDVEDVDPFACVPSAFQDGTGTGAFDRIGDFEVPTLDGTFSLSESWTGCETLAVVVYASPSAAGSSYYESLWNSSVEPLLEVEDTQILFVPWDGDAAALAEQQCGRLPDPRFHCSTATVGELDNALEDVLNANGVPPVLLVDREQRIRDTGLLYAFPIESRPSFKHVVSEIEYLAFEARREVELSLVDATIVPLFEQQAVSGATDVTITMPEGEFDTLELDLGLRCDDPAACEWDFLIDLWLCDEPDVCDTEIGRWVTPYGRGGRWVHDITPLLALLEPGEQHTFRFYTQQEYVTDLSMRLSDRGTGLRPSKATFLFEGAPFDAQYNESFQPVKLTVPDKAERVEVVATISGHGWGVEAANCAEFCDHTHTFSIGDVEAIKAHPEAGETWGCFDQMDRGVVPNQYGTWPLGRGGWCPGLEVAPWRADITDAVKSGADELHYEALVDGAPYVPQPSGSSDGFAARITMQAWVVTYEAM